MPFWLVALGLGSGLSYVTRTAYDMWGPSAAPTVNASPAELARQQAELQSYMVTYKDSKPPGIQESTLVAAATAVGVGAFVWIAVQNNLRESKKRRARSR